jgi:hypothetical protein
VRFYRIIITDPTSGAVLFQYTNQQNGRPDMGAPDIELDISNMGLAVPITGSSFVRIWGIPLAQIAQGNNLNGKSIAVYGGMQKGLPLANPAQAGLLVQGTISPAYGNWQGTAMTLDMQITPYLYASLQQDVNIVLNWKAGQPLATALQNAFATAFPASQAAVTISSALVQNYDEPSFHGNVQQLAQYVIQKTQAMVGGDYPGVEIAMNGPVITATDGTSPTTPTQINFQDLVGQPTWRDLSTLQVQTVMRGDIPFGAYAKLPPTLTAVTAAAVAPPAAGNISRSNSAFQGTFRVLRVRHVGRARQPDAGSWCSIFDLIQPPASSAPANAGPPI